MSKLWSNVTEIGYRRGQRNQETEEKPLSEGPKRARLVTHTVILAHVSINLYGNYWTLVTLETAARTSHICNSLQLTDTIAIVRAYIRDLFRRLRWNSMW